MQNPYTPPQSTLERDKQIPAQGKRPISAWILMLVLSVVIVLLVFGIGVYLNLAARRAAEIGGISTVLLPIGWRIAVLAASVVVLIGIVRRRQWARWTGLLVPVAMTIYFLLMPDMAQHANDAERFGGLIGLKVMMPALMAWWAYGFGFSYKATMYFDAVSNTGRRAELISGR